MEPYLEHCPFCGGEARLLHGGLSFMASIECTKCGASLKRIMEDGSDPVPSLIKAWNKRVVGGEFDGGYRHLSKSSQSQIERTVVEKFPGYKVSFLQNPDDESIIAVRLYDVENSDVSEYRKEVDKICCTFEEILPYNVCLVPSIVNSTDTEKYYPEYKRNR